MDWWTESKGNTAGLDWALPVTCFHSYFHFLLIMCIGGGEGVCAHDYRCLKSPEEGVRSLEAGVRGGCKPSNVGAWARAWDLCKSEAHCSPLSMLSNPVDVHAF